MVTMLLLAIAAQAGTPNPDTVVTGVKVKSPRKICKEIDSTGSRMGGYRECHTAAEWRAKDGPPLDARTVNNSMNTGGFNAMPPPPDPSRVTH